MTHQYRKNMVRVVIFTPIGIYVQYFYFVIEGMFYASLDTRLLLTTVLILLLADEGHSLSLDNHFKPLIQFSRTKCFHCFASHLLPFCFLPYYFSNLRSVHSARISENSTKKRYISLIIINIL